MNADLLVYGIGGIILLVAAFIVLRDFILWYYKIKERIKNQEVIISLLKKINENLESKK